MVLSREIVVAPTMYGSLLFPAVTYFSNYNVKEGDRYSPTTTCTRKSDNLRRSYSNLYS